MVLAALLAALVSPAGAWTFAVSGDSRNCGDLVLPAIARKAKQARAAFYWHLGDLRKIVDLDEDIEKRVDRPAPKSLEDYQSMAWDDFEESQVAAFGKIPFFLGIGNHETAGPKTREEFETRFARLLDAPALYAQRLADDPKDLKPRTYYHWRDRGVDFVYLDNATSDQFTAAQLDWLERVLKADLADASVRSLVVGMHEALPHSWSADHSMEQSPRGAESGERVYRRLLEVRAAGKRVYLLASHSHFYLPGLYDTPYWREHGGVLPGWLVGTGGAFRYPLPKGAAGVPGARTDVYGALIGSVRRDGSVSFRYEALAESDVPASVAKKFQPGLVHWCWTENHPGPGNKPW